MFSKIVLALAISCAAVLVAHAEEESYGTTQVKTFVFGHIYRGLLSNGKTSEENEKKIRNILDTATYNKAIETLIDTVDKAYDESEKVNSNEKVQHSLARGMERVDRSMERLVERAIKIMKRDQSVKANAKFFKHAVDDLKTKVDQQL